ncbi:oxidoreductase [Arthrobacter sp. AQ5-05]|uniref:molybdopterin-dependent oxidoreductase n=1 Tax=Arthrobacter sp. AQ5-05 TaxID=2184581 RepID=UPI000DCD362A|nr:molybdopterin-dependent oxidoreductase [Arthrobacter sp. AQ5-05]RAX48627.1 oxidoreductase [Arthrobacter sp. AQ5-05]
MNKSTASRMRDLGAFGLAGFAAAAVLFSVAQFVSAFFATASAPLVAMGSVFIDLTPPWLKDFAIATFGTNDKLALFISIGVIAAIAAVLVGILARRSYALAATCIVVLSVAIGTAVLSRPATGVVDLTPTILGSVAGLAALRWLTALASKARPPVPGGTPVPGASRRNFLIGTAVSLMGAAVATGVGKSLATARNVADAARSALGLPPAAVTAPPPPANAQIELAGMPKFITPNKDFYRIDTALSVPRINPSEWSLRVHGMVEKEFTMGFEELLAEDLVESYLTLTCVSNPVGGQLVGNAKWLGYPLRLLLERAVPRDGADMVLSTSIDGFSASTPLEVLTDDRMALLAVGMNGEPLPLEHGFPVRMVVPGLYGYVSATKWVVDLEVTRFAEKAAYWTTRGWSDRGPIKLSSRVDVPRSFASVPSGKVVMGGTAWAQTRGISKVQVQIDEGDWQDTELGAEASVDTWRQWRYEWDGGSTGNHVVSVRAFDGDGTMQTSEKADPVPDGASGWQRVQFSVE